MVVDSFPSDLEAFWYQLGNYILLLELICGEKSEPRPAVVDLPSEYRWDVDTSTEYIVGNVLAPFSVRDVEMIEELLVAVRLLPRKAPELTHRDWHNARRIAGKLLPSLRSHYAALPDFD